MSIPGLSSRWVAGLLAVVTAFQPLIVDNVQAGWDPAVGKGLGLLDVPNDPGEVVVKEFNKAATDVLNPSPGITVPTPDDGDKFH
ncbi:MAG: hypothetical protein WA705_09920 [Candidatus Ozemobacteraceae bacterium]